MIGTILGAEMKPEGLREGTFCGETCSKEKDFAVQEVSRNDGTRKTVKSTRIEHALFLGNDFPSGNLGPWVREELWVKKILNGARREAAGKRAAVSAWRFSQETRNPKSPGGDLARGDRQSYKGGPTEGEGKGEVNVSNEATHDAARRSESLEEGPSSADLYLWRQDWRPKEVM